ncbi:DUF3095 domain-containing protein [Seohaeicola zhoushanensis]|nr:DUF3095 domain-containing protein [Seohaeicola zhoushanensis]
MESAAFYDSLPRLAAFEALADPASYAALPDDWVVGCADIVGSTREIAAGRYKTVNMIGAAVISAQINAAGGRAFPYVFGGDGAAFATAPGQAGIAAAQLAAVQRWAGEEFGITLRIAQASLVQIRSAGVDVAVARHQASPDVDYAMFAGGGIAWLEARMKAGEFALPPARAGTRPDLTGLSCRWSHIRARNGTILSLVIVPAGGVPGTGFARTAEAVLSIARALDRDGHPIPVQGAPVGWPPSGIALEAQAGRRNRLALLAETFFAWAVLRFDLRVGRFDPRAYKQAVGRNADFRKFDDGLKMTLDCDPETVSRLRAVLDAAQAEGSIRYGLYEQEEAMMTCIVPSAMQEDHVHFIDGAAGGYALAAAQIKAR